MKKFLRSITINKSSRLSAKNKGMAKVSFFDSILLANPLLCTISGGQDSIAAFFTVFFSDYFFKQHFCGQQDQQLAFYLQVLYCQHFWQLKNFLASEFIFQLTFLVQVPYTMILPKHVLGGENESRGWRKKNFARILHFHKLSTIVTGQTASDGLEKNLNNLLRGTSPNSLAQSNLFKYKKRTPLFFSPFVLKPRKKNFQLFPKKRFFWTGSRSLETSTANDLFFFVGSQNQSDPLPNKFVWQRCFPKKAETKKPTKLLKLSKKTFAFFSYHNVLKDKKHKKSLGPYNSVSSSFCFFSKSYKTTIISYKPLLKLQRFNVSTFGLFFKFPIIIDLTNFSLGFSRNKIRHQLVPFIRSFFQRNFETLFTQFISIGIENSQEMEKKLDNFYYILKNKDLLLMKQNQTNLMILLEKSMQKSLAKKTIAEYTEQQLTFSHMSKLQMFLLEKFGLPGTRTRN